MPNASLWLMWVVAGYVAGATPFGWLIAKARGVDIRKSGSGNIGATNVGRVLGRRWGLFCFGLDVLKGLLPTAIFGCWMGAALHSTWGAGQWIGVGAAAMCGHMFPFWLKFKGGKGVATGLGALLGIWPVLTVAAVTCGLIWVIVTKTTAYVSLASITAAAALPVAAMVSGLLFGLGVGPIAVYGGVSAGLGLLVIVRHRGNIARLRAGTENKAAWARRW